jgi:hypothetical protein
VTGRFFQNSEKSLDKNAKSVLEFEAQLIAAKQAQDGKSFAVVP